MKKNNLKVLFVASECTPLAKVGGLGDVIGSLPKALKELGIDVRIVIPKYKAIGLQKYSFELIAKKIKVKNNFVNVYQGRLPKSKVILYLLENKKYFGENRIYFEKTAFVGSFKEIQRFLFFSQAVLEVFKNLNWKPDIIHCHDWHTAIVAPLLKFPISNFQFSKTKTLLTIHNLANQGGWRAKEVLDFLNLEKENLEIQDKRKRMNILGQGILSADFLNTVSPTYSREILTKQYGAGLEKILQKRKKHLFGILNGIDVERFNPRTDPTLKSNYSWKNLAKKIKNKTELQEISNFKKDSKIPLLGFIGRLTFQKGIDLIIEVLPELIKLNCQFVALGVGKADYEEKLLEFSQKYPKNISVQIKFDPVLAQKIYAGSDFILIPSKFEPCGLIQMIAMRYGTIPIARKTGGLADTIEDGKTGFLFEKYNRKSFWQAIKKALFVYSNKKILNLMQKRAMKKDFSWKKSAKKYIKLYKKLMIMP